MRTDGKPKGKIPRAYERFLELPVPVVLALLWIVGTMLMGLCALVFYLLWLLWAVTGA